MERTIIITSIVTLGSMSTVVQTLDEADLSLVPRVLETALRPSRAIRCCLAWQVGRDSLLLSRGRCELRQPASLLVFSMSFLSRTGVEDMF
jgi:hypothetical protein